MLSFYKSKYAQKDIENLQEQLKGMNSSQKRQLNQQLLIFIIERIKGQIPVYKDYKRTCQQDDLSQQNIRLEDSFRRNQKIQPKQKKVKVSQIEEKKDLPPLPPAKDQELTAKKRRKEVPPNQQLQRSSYEKNTPQTKKTKRLKDSTLSLKTQSLAESKCEDRRRQSSRLNQPISKKGEEEQQIRRREQKRRRRKEKETESQQFESTYPQDYREYKSFKSAAKEKKTQSKQRKSNK